MQISILLVIILNPAHFPFTPPVPLSTVLKPGRLILRHCRDKPLLASSLGLLPGGTHRKLENEVLILSGVLGIWLHSSAEGHLL